MTTDEELRELTASGNRMARENVVAIREMRAENEKRRAENEKRWAENEKERTEQREELRIQREGFEQRWEESRRESERRQTEFNQRWEESRRESERQRTESNQQWEESRRESERQRTESNQRWEESNQRWGESRRESERIWQEVLESRRESDRITANLFKEMRLLRQEVGNIGHKLGIYTESIFFPSLERILREDFGMQVVEPRALATCGGESFEVDVLAHANDEIDTVFNVEIKTQLRQDAIDQILDHLRRFAQFFPEHRGKKAYGILGALDIPADVKAKALKAGIYVASIRDDVFELLQPEGFKPRAFPV